MRFKRFAKANWRVLLFAILGGAIGGALVAMMSFDMPLATAMVAFGTLLLALVTAMAIDNSKRQEERRRKDELAKEKRLRDERLLDEVRDWAVNILAIMNEYQYVNRDALIDLRTRAFTAKAAIPNITVISKGFRRKFISLVGKACDELDAFTGLINDTYLKNVHIYYTPPTSGFGTVIDRGYEQIDTPRVSDELEPIFTSLIEEAAKIKATL